MVVRRLADALFCSRILFSIVGSAAHGQPQSNDDVDFQRRSPEEYLFGYWCTRSELGEMRAVWQLIQQLDGRIDLKCVLE